MLDECIGLHKFTRDNANGFTSNSNNLFRYIKGMLELFNDKRVLKIGVGVPEMSIATALVTIMPFALGNITDNTILIIVSICANSFSLYAQHDLEKATRDVLDCYVKILNCVLRSVDEYEIDAGRIGTHLTPTEKSLFSEYSFTISRILRFVDRN